MSSAKKENLVGPTLISSFDYSVNAIGQRTGVATAGTAFSATPDWNWGYNSRGEVISALNPNTPAQDQAYDYDAIGNRKTSSGTITADYSTNPLNQYTAIDPTSSAAVTPAYDVDGNATAYPVPANPTANASLTWDAENRLIRIDMVDGTVVENSYDYLSRRIASTTTPAGGVSETITYLYDGWNVVVEHVGTTLSKTYTWGTDLSGTMQGAGGVGGLLSQVAMTTSSNVHHYPTYDGNGNVSEYLTGSGAIAAHFEYDPFGNTTVASNTNGSFAYRFSTKPIEASGLYYYGYRYYDPQTGRWPSRDPIEEQGGVNLYAFVNNDGLNKWDYLGLDEEAVNCVSIGRSISLGIYILLGGEIGGSVSGEICDCCDKDTGEKTDNYS